MRACIYMFLFLLYNNAAKGQQFLKGFSLKAGMAISTQAYHNTAFLPTIKGHHNIVAPFINLQYSWKLSEKAEISAAIQQVEKGFIFKSAHVKSGTATSYSTEYQYRLGYVEMSINFTFHVKRFGGMIGWIPSYLYEANYRYKDVTNVNQTGKPAKVFVSSYNGVYPFSRFRTWDMGINLGLKYKLNDYFEVELNVQKHFLRTDMRAPQTGYADIMYNQSYLLGLRYSFLSL